MTNGVAVFAHNLANGLAERGHEVMVICPSFRREGKHYREKDPKTGVITMHLKSRRLPIYPDQINAVPEKKQFLGIEMPRLTYKYGIWYPPNPYPELKRALNRFRPDVIHLQTAEMIAIATRHYVKTHDVPLVSTGHAYPDNITSQFKWLKPVKKPVDAVLRTYMASFLKHSEYATMPTEMAIDDLIPKKRKHFKVPVEALSNGVNLEAFQPGKPDLKICEKYGITVDIINKPCVLYVGRIDPEKSIEVTLNAFAETLKAVPDAQFILVGDGIAKPELEKQVAELGISENVHFTGRVLPPDLYELYKVGKVFATASETETQGIVLIEAAATGLPLVAVDAGAVKELCQNRFNGILCPPKDISALSKALTKILTDNKLQKTYSAHSLEVAAQHDLTHTLSRFEEIYTQAITAKTESMV